jgi:hypothetical protein
VHLFALTITFTEGYKATVLIFNNSKRKSFLKKRNESQHISLKASLLFHRFLYANKSCPDVENQ